MPDVEGFDFTEGVSGPWLAQAFGVTQQTVRNRLALCAKRKVRGRGVMYNFKEAVAYLTPHPKASIEEYLDTTDPGDLPIRFQKQYWEMRKKRLEVEKIAGELWHTDDVRDAFSEVFQQIKAVCQLWPDDVDRADGLTTEQRKTLVQLSDSFQDAIYAKIEDTMTKRDTRSAFQDIEDEIAGKPQDEVKESPKPKAKPRAKASSTGSVQDRLRGLM